MQPTRLSLAKPIPIAGISIRTTNAAEFNPVTGKIAGLWGRFFSEGLFDSLPNKLPDSPIYGVYSGYESDYMGAFDVTAGVAVTKPDKPLALQAGEYLVFSATGPMPQTVLQTWGVVWQYFQSNPNVQRSYATDFEAYSGTDKVEIHIGVQV
ncbi:MAG: GyrI-like domain-containing protein [Polaromonas sp.]